MPAGYAHLMISDEALKHFKEEDSVGPELRNPVDNRLSFIYAGSVAPDYPYLRLRESEQSVWADHMHYEYTGDVLKSMAQRLLEVSSEKGFAADEFTILFFWTLGYLSHITADLVVHPFVYSIVGSYKGHEDDHRVCEMIQDAYIYKRITGQEIEESRVLERIQESADPDDGKKIHPFLRNCWCGLLQTHFLHDFNVIPPNIDNWHENYLELMEFAGNAPFIGKSLSTLMNPEAPYTYQPTTKMSFADRAIYHKEFRLPDGEFGTYEKDVFPRAVRCVADRWTQLGAGLTAGDLSAFLENTVNCDLDTGYETSRLRYW